jgi:pimeloyl-ACP methyl ester carboxylesterase
MSKNWVFIRGLTRGVVHWGEFAKKFQDLHPDYKIEFIEIPGNGELSEMLTPKSPEELIEYLRSKSDIVKSAEEYNLCGISLGGMIVLKWAELYPDRISTVNVINTSLSQFSPFYKRLLASNYIKVAAGLFSSNPYQKEKLILNMTANNAESITRYLQIFTDFAKVHSVKKINFIRQIQLAKKIKIDNWKNTKLNVISSTSDRLVSHSCSKMIAQKLNGKLIIHSSAGHDIPLDDPSWLIQALDANN